MAHENTIPPITHPMGRHWDQPPLAEILIDDKVAVMTKRTFEFLHEYSGSIPTGVYPGKMWRRHDGIFDRQCKEPVWMLCWFGESTDPDKCSINRRPILFV